MNRTILALTAAGCLVISTAAVAQSAGQPRGPFQPVGLWRFHHTDGTPFLARLKPDQTATTDWAGGETGIWRWEGARVRLVYTDGWDDVLYLANAQFHKAGYAPDADRCAAPSNDTAAEKLSDKPDASP